jgi:UDP-N-acetylmuramoylalanine--D-glutamate ligase
MELEGKKVLVFGSGKSGIGACKLLLKAGAVPYIYDQNENLDRKKLQEQFEKPDQIAVVVGELPEAELSGTDLVIMSPGIPCDIPVVERFYAAKIPVWSEVELAYRTGKGKILAITGTNGKTTTTSLLGKIMQDYYPEVYVVGNIGTPYTDVSLEQSEQAWTVAEISSFQLETIDEFHPIASAITNITEDHLNRHHTMEEYIRVKELITKNQGADDLCVLNYEDEVLRAFGKKLKCQAVYFSSLRPLDEGIYLEDGMIRIRKEGTVTDVIHVDEMQLLGLHNFENVMTAAVMADFAGVPMGSIRQSIREFSGVAHRIEYVTEKAGVRYYNDSKGTNPDAAIKAIQAMNRPTVLIGGGYDKESSYEEWIESFDGKVQYFVLIGQTREKIKETAICCGFPEDRIIFAEDLKEAVSVCASHAKDGWAVLLSPACASWGQFDNYEQRGDLFKEYVREL